MWLFALWPGKHEVQDPRHDLPASPETIVSCHEPRASVLANYSEDRMFITLYADKIFGFHVRVIGAIAPVSTNVRRASVTFMEASMPRPTGNGRRRSTRNRNSKSRHTTEVKSHHPPQDLASLVRGLYQRVASRLGVDPSYVSRVARRERHSKLVGDALRRELRKIITNFNKQCDSPRKKRARKTGAKRSAKSRTKPT
jgi:hypothetical protein